MPKITSQIKKLYKEGKSQNEIAKVLSVTRPTVRNHLVKAGVSIRPLEMIRDKDVIKLHANGKTSKEIQKILGFGEKAVLNCLKRNGLKLKRPRKYSLNEKYFEHIDTPEKAYWLGFILSDGHIKPGKHGPQSLDIALKADDADHLRILRRAVNYGGNIKIKSVKAMKEGTKCFKVARLSISSYEFSTYLENLGVSAFKKQGDLGVVDKINPEFYVHFMRGLFDGDGGLFVDSNNNAFFSFIDMHKSVVVWFQEWLMKHTKLMRVNLKKHNNAYSFQYGGNIQVLRILELLYNEGGPRLDRKYEKFLKFKWNLPPQSDFTCPTCGRKLD